MIENPRTGEQVEFELELPERLVMRSTWTRPGHRAIEHAHPRMEERFQILEGTAAFFIRGEERIAQEGDVVIVPPGSTHVAWNPTNRVVRLRITMTPALRWAEFTRRLFGGDDPGMLLREYAEEVILQAR